MQETAIPQNFRAQQSSNILALAWTDQGGADLLEDDSTGKPYPTQNAEDGTLGVIFRNGTRYQYQGIPRQTVLELLTARSVGAAFNILIRGNAGFVGVKVAESC